MFVIQYTMAATQFGEFNRLKVDLIKTDLNVAITFTEIATESTNEETKHRNRGNARKAYDSVLHFLSTAILTPIDEKEITTKLALLKSALMKLGEAFYCKCVAWIKQSVISPDPSIAGRVLHSGRREEPE